MKYIVLLIAVLTIWTSSAAQELNPKTPDLRKIYDLLQSGNAEEAYGQTVAAMKIKGLDPFLTAKLLNFRINGLAQMFIAEKISYEELKSETQKIPLGPIDLIGHEFSTSMFSLNSIAKEKDDPLRLHLAEFNQNGTYMYTMFTIKLKPGPAPVLTDGTVYFISGNLTALTFHPSGRGSYVFRATVEDGVVNEQ